MALRTIREMGDPILEKKCRPIKEMNDKIKILIEDMFDTMYEADGVGLAGPQVGVLKRICVIDTREEGEKVCLINPEILETSGEQEGDEGCLSVPGRCGLVRRPAHVVVKAFNENMEEVEVTGDDLFARAILHEMDHMDGILYVTKVEGELKYVNSGDDEEDSEEDTEEE
ncbi:MAG: peptide deformylase [Lachnospiraceae bacterium]|nr:peptide deformylase [Lachnospiraceae bacterium]